MLSIKGLYFALLCCATLMVSLSAQNNQNSRADSLCQQLASAGQDNVRLEITTSLFWEWRRKNLDSAMKYAEKHLKYANESGFAKRIGEAYYFIGIINKSEGNYEQALENYAKARDKYKACNYTNGVISCIIEEGVIFHKKGSYEKALIEFHKARNFSPDSISQEKFSRINSMIGGVYGNIDQFDKALEYHNESLEINRKNGFALGKSVNYNNIGNVYRFTGRYDKAIENYLIALKIKDSLGDAMGYARVQNNLGLAYNEKGNFEEAIKYHNKFLEFNAKRGDQKGISAAYINLGFDYLKMKKWNEAVNYTSKGLEISLQQEQLGSIAESYDILSKASEALGDYQNAFKYQRLYQQYRDSLVNEDVMKKIARIENRFEIEKREKEIALLNTEREKQALEIDKQRVFRNLMIVTVILILSILVMVYTGLRNKQKVNLKLREINEVKSRFFANIAHEFKTPLTLLIGPLENLAKTADKNNMPLINMMHRNATKLLFRNNQLMDLSRLESGAIELQLRRSNLTTALKGMVMSFESLARQKNIGFACQFPKDNYDAVFDNDKLEKIIYNLLSNAFKFTPDNGKVSFSAKVVKTPDRSKILLKNSRTEIELLHIEVSDTGKGIAAEHQQKIFERFYQESDDLSRGYEGTGLGLAITREFVDLHKGTITVESQPGKGSVFTVFLPVDEKAFPKHKIHKRQEILGNEKYFGETVSGQIASNETDRNIPVSSVETEGDDHSRLLIIEDNEDMRKYIIDSLKTSFSFIFEAENGMSGFDVAAEKLPDLIITDLMMPEMDGMKLCDKLKADERTSHIPVIMLTALNSEEHKIKGLKTGADDYLVKPFNKKELIIRSNNLIAQRRKLREKFLQESSLIPDGIAATPADERFLSKAKSSVEKHLSNPDFGVELMMSEVGMSRSQLHRKLKALSGQSTTEFIRTIRLKKAAGLLKVKYGSVADVCYTVGFNSLSYFTKCFHDLYGVPPSEYGKGQKG